MTLQQAKSHLWIVNEDFDERLGLALKAAIDYCETVTGRVLRVSKTVVQSYDGWPCSPVRFDYQPAYSITSVTYYDADNAQQTVSASNYRLVQGNVGAVLELDADYSKPTVYERADAVQVTYLAGYEDLSNVPDAAKYAILLTLETQWGGKTNIEADAVERSVGSLLATIDVGAYR